MRTTQRKPRGQSLNSEKNPYMRDDFWASGYFDFLWKSGISRNYRERLNAIKDEAIRSSKNLSHRPSVKSANIFDRTHKVIHRGA